MRYPVYYMYTDYDKRAPARAAERRAPARMHDAIIDGFRARDRGGAMRAERGPEEPLTGRRAAGVVLGAIVVLGR
eukprot:COSAG02_NODE_44593_length_364_cov_162.328302_1_plen_74_part_10